jgi:hypothetical protein
MKVPTWLGSLLALVLSGSCSSGQSPLTGIGEPVQLANGQFIPGNLPGSPPANDGGVVEGDAGVDAGTDAGPPPALAVRDLGGFNSTIVQPGEAGKAFSGDVSNDAVAVGVSLAGMGTGYWVVPVGSIDSMDPSSFTFSISANFNLNDPPGLRNLLFVAIDGAGHAGVQAGIQLCLSSRIPDNGHACNPLAQPPSAVFTLEWDTNFDLDLHVVTPDGLDINPREPYGEPVEAGPHGIPADLPHVDRDSLGDCVPDGLRQEDIVFQDPLPIGTYLIYVDPFAACGQAAARFKFTIYEASGTCPACSLHSVSSVSGEALASQVTGGAGAMLKIDQITVN